MIFSTPLWPKGAVWNDLGRSYNPACYFMLYNGKCKSTTNYNQYHMVSATLVMLLLRKLTSPTYSVENPHGTQISLTTPHVQVFFFYLSTSFHAFPPSHLVRIFEKRSPPYPGFSRQLTKLGDTTHHSRKHSSLET